MRRLVSEDGSLNTLSVSNEPIVRGSRLDIQVFVNEMGRAKLLYDLGVTTKGMNPTLSLLSNEQPFINLKLVDVLDNEIYKVEWLSLLESDSDDFVLLLGRLY
jgi:hypothetical protein